MITGDLVWKEQFLYGSSRLGRVNLDRVLDPICYDCPPAPNEPDVTIVPDLEVTIGTVPELEYRPQSLTSWSFGQRQYEMTNHLGNVTTVFGEQIERLTPNEDLHRLPRIISQTDYLPFGLQYRWKTDATESDYRYGFNGKEKDSEGKWGANSTVYDYGFRVYDPGVARFLSVDPLAPSFAYYSPYQYAGNSPVLNIDMDGLEKAPYYVRHKLHTGLPVFERIWKGFDNLRGEIWNGFAGTWNYTVEKVERAVEASPAVAISEIENDIDDLRRSVKRYVNHTLIEEFTEDFGEVTSDPAFPERFTAGVLTLGLTFTKTRGFLKRRPGKEGSVTEAGPTQPIGGAARAAMYSSSWSNGSLSQALARFAPKAEGVSTKSGKTLYLNAETGIQVVYDNAGKYFRIEDTKLSGKRKYLDMEGNIPNSKTLPNGKTVGRNQGEYNQVTHFNNTDV